MSLLVLSLVPGYIAAKRQEKLALCKSNLKSIAVALEAYAGDNGGIYPPDLNQLKKGNYLKSIPSCPAAKDVTYLDYQVGLAPNLFSVSCCGDNHARAYNGFPGSSTVNLPAYYSARGLIAHPGDQGDRPKPSPTTALQSRAKD